MPADSVLVVDAGTSALRAVLVRADGETQTLAAEPWPMFVPDDAAPFGREYDALGWERVRAWLNDAVAPHRERIAGVAVCGQREGLAFLDDEGSALLVSPNIDARASAEGIAIDATAGERVYDTTGRLPSLLLAPAKLQWLRAHRPDDARSVACVLPLADWLAMLLTGERRMSRSLAAEVGLLDVTSRALAADLLHDLDFDASLAAAIVDDGAIGGSVREGPLAGLPVVYAGADTQCALIGAGAIAPGDAAAAAGWSAPVQLVTAAPVIDPRRRTWTGLHVTPGAWIVESNAGETGRPWEWLCGMLAVDARAAFDEAASAPVGANDVMFARGPRAMNASAMNAAVGALTMPLPLVMSAPSRADLLRAMLESIACAIRANVEQLERVAAARIEQFALGGGMARSPLFAQIVAEVCGRSVAVAASHETSALGAAALAAPALALHASLDTAVEAMTQPRVTACPRPKESAAYDDIYTRWSALADHMEAAP